MAVPLLVTPEAVVLDLTSAGIPTRMVARVLDVLVQAALLLVLFLGAGIADSSGVPSTPLVVVVLFGASLILLGYPMVFETLWRGRTLGKAAMGLRVVTKEGAPIRLRHAVIRGGADIVDVWGLGLLAVIPGIVGTIAIFASKDGQRLGDMAAGTVVIRERSGAKVPTSTAFAVPPGLEAYADTVDVSRLSESDYLVIRSFLLRARALAPQARAQVAASLAPSIALRLQIQPPAWVTPEQLLAVVAARRQQRGGFPVAALAPAPGWSQPEHHARTQHPWGTTPQASTVWPGAVPLPESPDRTTPPARLGPSDHGFTAPR